MRILHVLYSARAEGTPRLVLDWLKLEDYEQSVLFLSTEHMDLQNEFQGRCKRIYFYETAGKRKDIFASVYQHCRQHHYDILISWNQGYSPQIVRAGKQAGVASLLVHAGCAPETATRFQKLYNYYVDWQLTLFGAKIVCASNHIRNRFFSLPLLVENKYFVVYNCIDLNKFLNVGHEQEKYTAINVGNLEPTKDQAFLIESWKHVVKEIPAARLTIVGKGTLEVKLQNLIVEYQLKDNVVLLGARKDVPQLLAKNELFLLSSQEGEGFGTVLIEAMAAGNKIVSLDIPSSKEVLQEGKFGVLVKERNPLAFAKEVIKALNSEAQFPVANAYLQNFTPEKMMREYLNIAQN